MLNNNSMDCQDSKFLVPLNFDRNMGKSTMCRLRNSRRCHAERLKKSNITSANKSSASNFNYGIIQEVNSENLILPLIEMENPDNNSRV